jgi:hypothetical protein
MSFQRKIDFAEGGSSSHEAIANPFADIEVS